jgi:hypothetical protein
LAQTTSCCSATDSPYKIEGVSSKTPLFFFNKIKSIQIKCQSKKLV